MWEHLGHVADRPALCFEGCIVWLHVVLIYVLFLVQQVTLKWIDPPTSSHMGQPKNIHCAKAQSTNVEVFPVRTTS